MDTIKQQNRVATDNLGYTYGEFMGVYDKDYFDRAKGKHESMSIAVFKCPAIKKGQFSEITIPISGYYATSSVTGRFLKTMGFKYEAKSVINEEGLEQIEEDNLDEALDYIDTLSGNNYKFKIIRDEKKLDRIDVDTIILKTEQTQAA